jgi:hypothetical protein
MTKQQPKTKSSIEQLRLQEDPESKVGMLPDTQDLASPPVAGPGPVADTNSIVANEGQPHDCRLSPTLPTEVANDRRSREGVSRKSPRTPEVEAIKRQNLRELLERDYQMKFNENNLAICPFHDDHKPSLKVFKGNDGYWRWYCFGCKEDEKGKKGGDYFDFKARKEGRPLDDILKGVSPGSGASAKHPRRKPIATYVYEDEAGHPVYRKLKYNSELYNTQRYENGKWISGLNGTRRVLYNLPELVRASQVFLLEGEKDCETVKDLGFVATTMGSIAQWKAEYATCFAGKDVAICFDVGNEKVADRAARDIASHAKSVKALSLPGLTEREQDITDWFERMGGEVTVEEKRKKLLKIVDQTPLFLAGATEPVPKSSAKSMTLSQFLNKKVPPREIFMDYWVEREQLTILAGPQKAGKSILSVNLGLSLAFKRDFLGFGVPKPRRVLYVQQEIPESAMLERLRKMLCQFESPSLDNFMIENTSGTPLKLTNHAGVERLKGLVESNMPDLLILDPFSTFHDDKDENSESEMASVLEPILGLKHQFKIGVLLIHHFGKPSLAERKGSHRLRGSSVIGDRADSMVLLDPLNPAKNGVSLPNSGSGRISFVLRSDADPGDILVRLDPASLWFVRADQDAPQQGGKLPAEAIVEAIRDHGGEIRQLELEALLKPRASRGTVLKAVEEAVARGLLELPVRLPEPGGPVLLKLKGGLS